MTTSPSEEIQPLIRSGAGHVQARRSKTPAIGRFLLACGLGATLLSPLAPAVTIPDTPLITAVSATPMTMLVASKDHKLFYEAYNDASDIDGDGALDLRFNPEIIYYGLFDSSLCYSYDDSDGLFAPVGYGNDGNCASVTTSSSTSGSASGSSGSSYGSGYGGGYGGSHRRRHYRWGSGKSSGSSSTSSSSSSASTSGTWSGNWLNYVTTSRIDALRKVLYGGYRDVDNDTQTILRRAYIPQDDHTWAKEYTSEDVDGYKISDYTELSEPSSGKRHFFGNLTANATTNCQTLSNCSDLAPLLRVVTNSSGRVWEWASSERPVLDDSSYRNTYGGGTISNYTVRAEVCTEDFHEGCKSYPNGQYKPVGILHEFGEEDAMLFGLITGSYNKNMSGGVLRKVVSSFADEVDPDTGQFSTDDTIVKTLDLLRIRDYNNGRTDQTYRSGWFLTGPMSQGDFVDWGNPVAEMMYEGLRYFAGKGAATSAYATSGGVDAEVGLSAATWDVPYSESSAAKAPWCANANLLVMSDINPSFDSDQLPGVYSEFGSFSGDLSGLDVKALGDTITAEEGVGGGSYFIGQSGTDYDGAPTAKTVESLGTIRGLAPDEPTKQGSYYSASVAYYGKTNDLSPVENEQTTDSFFVALASPLPRIKFPVGSHTVTLVPFAKSVGGGVSGQTIDRNDFAPTNQIVDFYVDTLANLPGAPSNSSVNGGRPYAKFRINFEDVEQGADHDMDAIVLYEIQETAAGQVEVKLTSEYAAGSIIQHIGYVISGTTDDGVYLTVRDEDTSQSNDVDYFLDYPDSSSALPTNSTQVFTPGGSSASLLDDPLWYAAKWGGFIDRNDNDIPDQDSEWDENKDGVPDTYFLVQNPLSLAGSLKRALNNVIDRTASGGNVTANSTSITGSSLVFQALFTTGTWSGDVLAYPITTSGVGAIPRWKASEHIPDPDGRVIYTTKSDGTVVEFLWSKLADPDAPSSLSLDQIDLVSEDVLNYLRGVRDNELQKGGSLRDRATANVLGDTVHSSPYYVKDTDTIYIGSNDGMLHGFDTASGAELFAYIPSAVIPRLADLADPTYVHEYFVDGAIAGSTTAQTPDENYIVATLGRGGKGLFALDVTTPSAFTASSVKWEYFNASDGDLGYMLGRPLIAEMNDGSMAVIVGNGYNSSSGRAVLYIFDLTSGALIKKLDTLATGDNGLATPGLFDKDGDGDVDFIYAGDLLGNVWKFDVQDSSTDSWDVAFYGSTSDGDLEPEPFFTATDKDVDGTPQPITAPITVAVDTVATDTDSYGKRFVFFGTGSYFRASDPNDVHVQTWYGLIDEGSQISGRGELMERSVEAVGTTDDDQNVRVFSKATAGDMSEKRGWYIDLTDADGNAEGERIITSSLLYFLVEPVLIVSSIIPVEDPCLPGGRGYVNAINPFTGGRLTEAVWDVNGNDDFSDDTFDGKQIGSVDLRVGMPAEPVLVGDRLVVGGSSGEVADLRVNMGGAEPILGRVSWRQIR